MTMIVSDPQTAYWLLKLAAHGYEKYGLCKHCPHAHRINRTGLLRKHDGCEQDYPSHLFYYTQDETYAYPLDELAEIAATICKTTPGYDHWSKREWKIPHSHHKDAFRKLAERMESLPNATQQTLEWAKEIRKIIERGR